MSAIQDSLLRIGDTIVVYYFNTIDSILPFLNKSVTDATLVDEYTTQMGRGYQTGEIKVNNTVLPTTPSLGETILTKLGLTDAPSVKRAFLIVMSYLVEIASTLLNKNGIITDPYLLINPSEVVRATNFVTIVSKADRQIEGSIQLSYGIGKMSGSGSPELINEAGSTTNQANRRHYGSIVCKYTFKLIPEGTGSVHCTYTITGTDRTILANIRKIPDSLPELMANYAKISQSLVERLKYPEHTPGKNSGKAEAKDKAAFNECKEVVANTFLPAMHYLKSLNKLPVSVRSLTALFPEALFPREVPPTFTILDYILYMYMTVNTIKNAPCYTYPRVKALANNAAKEHSSVTSLFTGSRSDPHHINKTLLVSETILGIDAPSSSSSAAAAARSPSNGMPPSSSSEAAVPPLNAPLLHPMNVISVTSSGLPKSSSISVVRKELVRLRSEYDKFFEELHKRSEMPGKDKLGNPSAILKGNETCTAALKAAYDKYNNELPSQTDINFFKSCLDLIKDLRATVSTCPEYVRIINLLDNTTTGSTTVNVPLLETQTLALLSDLYEIGGLNGAKLANALGANLANALSKRGIPVGDPVGDNNNGDFGDNTQVSFGGRRTYHKPSRRMKKSRRQMHKSVHRKTRRSKDRI